MPASGRSTEALAAYEGFDHNAQSLRVVTQLERRYPAFDGLNLTWETLEGLVKHNGPLLDAAGRAIGPHAGGELPFAIRAYQERQDLELARLRRASRRRPPRSPTTSPMTAMIWRTACGPACLSLADLEEQPLAAPILAAIRAEYPGLEAGAHRPRARPPHDHAS